MLDVDIAADGELGQRATEAARKYVQEHAAKSYPNEDAWPVARSQITGLVQIARNEPTKVGDFAEHQRKKVEAKIAAMTRNEERLRHLTAEKAFWELVRSLCDGKPSNCSWSLTQARDHALPAELHDEKQPPGTQLKKEEQTARIEKRQRRERWQRQWEMDYYPVFFQRFCIHYLYEMAKRTQGD